MARRHTAQGTGFGRLGVVAALAAVVALSTPARATSISLSGGASTSTTGSQTLEFVLVTGTGGSGNPSTYTATESGAGELLTITDAGASVTLSDFGVMIADIAVDAAGGADVSTGGSLSVNRAATFAGGVSVASGGSIQIGTLGVLDTSGGDLSLSGAGSLVRSGNGTYSTGSLTLGSMATATFVAGDAITGNAVLTGTSSLVVQSALASTGWADVSDGSTLTANATTSFDLGVFAYAGGTLAIGATGSVTTPGLYLVGADAFSRTSGGTYSTGILSIADLATVDFVAGDAVSGDVLVDTGAILDIRSALATTGDVWVSNGAALSRTTATVSATTLHVGGASTVQTIAGDALDTVSVSSGGQFSNAAPLTLSALSVSGDDGSGHVSTATTGAALTIIDGGSVQVTNGGRLFVSAPLAVAAGGSATLTVSGTASDGAASAVHVFSSLSGFSSVDVGSGATLDLDGGSVTADTLSMGGASAFTRTGGSYTVGTLYLADAAAASYVTGDSITTSVVLLSGATLDLGKNLVLTDSLTLGDNAAITRTTATITAPTVTVAGVASLALGAGDSVGSLSLSGGGRVSSSTALVLDGATPLTITDAGSLLTLTTFDGLVSTATPQLHYALRLYGDQQTLLTSYLSEGRIALGSSPQTPGVIYNPALYGNVTFIAYAVPEPSTVVFVVGALATLPLLRRRRR